VPVRWVGRVTYSAIPIAIFNVDSGTVLTRRRVAKCCQVIRSSGPPTELGDGPRDRRGDLYRLPSTQCRRKARRAPGCADVAANRAPHDLQGLRRRRPSTSCRTGMTGRTGASAKGSTFMSAELLSVWCIANLGQINFRRDRRLVCGD
jgi:hypothetical protein